jgi:flagellar assembly protein FliH
VPLIKQPETVASRMFSLGDIAVEAKGILERARRQAEQAVAAANAECDAIREQARKAGYEAGLVAGAEEGQKAARQDAVKKFEQQLARAVRALAEALEQVSARKARALAEARQDLVRLALAVAEKVLRRELAADPAACVRTVEAAVELAGRASRLSVRVNPADLELVRSVAPQLAAQLTGEAEVEVVADEQVESGGCKLTAFRETAQPSEIDATIATQLDRLAGELLGKQD